MQWRKLQLDAIKRGQINKDSKKQVYKSLLIISKENSFLVPTFEKFTEKWEAIEDSQEFYSVVELSQCLHTSTQRILKWFQNYSSVLKPINNEGVERRFLVRFIKQFPGEIVNHCQPDLLWLLSIL